MPAKLIPIAFLILGMAAGAAAALFLEKPDVSAAEQAAADGNTPLEEGERKYASENGKDGPPKSGKDGPAQKEYVRLANQFVVPVVERGEIRSLVLLTLSIETAPGHQEEIFSKQPKLRDSFLEVLFDYSNTGGFAGTFTNTSALQSLKSELTAVARRELGDFVEAVLIEDIMRQDK